MRVILLQDVAKLGRRFEVVDVPHGYGLNKLVPQGLAEVANPENLKKIKAQSAKTEADRAAGDAAFTEVSAALTESVAITVEANEDGKLYQALKAEDIITALNEVSGSAIDPSWLLIKSPIKNTGESIVSLMQGEQVKDITLNVTAA